MKTYFLKALTVLSAFIFLQGCYPGGAEYTSDLDIAISHYDSQEKLSEYNTFYIVTDSMSIIGIGTDYTLDLEDQQQIAEYTRLKLISELGLTEIENPTEENQPDLFVHLTQIALQQSGVVWQPPYWPGYPGYPGYPGWPGWGWPGYPGYGYPWYGGGYSYYSYSNGTILLDFVDVAATQENNVNTPADERYELILGWQGALNGVLSRANNTTLIENGIDVLLDQYIIAEDANN